MKLGLIAAAFLVAAIGFTGEQDYQQAKDDADHYADMVCGGHWTDYENRQPECE